MMSGKDKNGAKVSSGALPGFVALGGIFESGLLGVFGLENMHMKLKQKTKVSVIKKGEVIYDKTVSNNSVTFLVEGRASAVFSDADGQRIYLGEISTGSFMANVMRFGGLLNSQDNEQYKCIGINLKMTITSPQATLYTISCPDVYSCTNAEIVKHISITLRNMYDAWNIVIMSHRRQRRAALSPEQPKNTHTTPIKRFKKISPAIGFSRISKFAQLGRHVSDQVIIEQLFPSSPTNAVSRTAAVYNSPSSAGRPAKRKGALHPKSAKNMAFARRRQTEMPRRPQSARMKKKKTWVVAKKNKRRRKPRRKTAAAVREVARINTKFKPKLRPKSASRCKDPDNVNKCYQSQAIIQNSQLSTLVKWAAILDKTETKAIEKSELNFAENEKRVSVKRPKGMNYYVERAIKDLSGGGGAPSSDPRGKPEDRLLQHQRMMAANNGRPQTVSSKMMSKTWQPNLESQRREVKMYHLLALRTMQAKNRSPTRPPTPNPGRRIQRFREKYVRPKLKLMEKLRERENGTLNPEVTIVGRVDRNKAINIDDAILSRVHVQIPVAKRAHQMARNRRNKEELAQKDFIEALYRV